MQAYLSCWTVTLCPVENSHISPGWKFTHVKLAWCWNLQNKATICRNLSENRGSIRQISSLTAGIVKCWNERVRGRMKGWNDKQSFYFASFRAPRSPFAKLVDAVGRFISIHLFISATLSNPSIYLASVRYSFSRFIVKRLHARTREFETGPSNSPVAWGSRLYGPTLSIPLTDRWHDDDTLNSTVSPRHGETFPHCTRSSFVLWSHSDVINKISHPPFPSLAAPL